MMIRTTDLEKRFFKEPSFIIRKIGDEFILVPIHQKGSDIQSIFTMEEVAGRIWELIDGKSSFAEIRDVIVKEFEDCLAEWRPFAIEVTLYGRIPSFPGQCVGA